MSRRRVSGVAVALAGALAGVLAGALISVPVPTAAVASAGPTDHPTTSHSYPVSRARAVVERRVIGHSVQGRPIVAFRKGNPDARLKVVVLGQMHGDEPAGAATVKHLKDRLPVDSDADVWLVRTMNPDGAAAFTRGNARGVDLNRNWPTNGWRRGPRDRYYPGPSRASEPETRAMMAFLRAIGPRYVVSIHQPLAAVGRNRKAGRFVRRLSANLGLEVRALSVGTPAGKVSPTLTGWYNERFAGVAVTVEYGSRPTVRYRTVRAGTGILRAAEAGW